MGTNATKKAASKIVAILLAALMLISVMPMTAFAASVPATIVVDGLTLISEPDEDEYDVGDPFEIDGFELEVTFKLAENIKDYGEAAKQYTVVIDDVADFVKYGITCNYEDGYKMTIADNLKPLTFNYGVGGKLEFVTDCFFAVYPEGWLSAALVEYFNTDETTEGTDADYADLIILADGKYALSADAFSGKPGVGTLIANQVLATYELKVNSSNYIADVLSQLPADIDPATVVWAMDEFEITDNGYAMKWENYKADDGILSVTSSADVTTYDSEWPVLLGDSADWAIEDGKMITNITTTVLEKEVTVSGGDIKTEYVEVEKEIPLYIAVKDGFYYLTADKDDAAKIDLYAIEEFEINDIEIAKNPDKMTYYEGEEFDPAGMVVNLLYNDQIVSCVPAELFDVYGIYLIQPAQIGEDEFEKLSITAHNDISVKVMFSGMFLKSENEIRRPLYDETDTKLTVKALGAFKAEIPAGSLADGNYVIGWFDEVEGGKMASNKLYEGQALDADFVTYQRVSDSDASSTYSASTLASSPVQAMNNKLGVFNAYKDYTAIDDSMIWTVKYAGRQGYTIQQASTGKFLTRNELSYNDLWVADINAENGNNADAKTVKAEVKTLVLADAVSENAYWDIDGVFNVAIQSMGDSNVDNFYLVSKTINDTDSFLAADIDNTAGALAELEGDNFYFFKTGDITVKSIEITHSALLKDLKSGDAVDLHDLVVALTYSDNTTVQVPYDDFVSYGITCNYQDGQILAASDNGKKFTVSVGDKSDDITLKVEDSNAQTLVVRMGGADRFETAAIIADNYIKTLKDEYKNVAVLVNSEQFPDALAGATLAAALKAPIVITPASSLNPKTKDVLVDNSVKTVYVLGGKNAIGDDVIAALKDLKIDVKVIAGANRVETSVAIAKQLAAEKGYSDTVIITNGANFADALSVSSAAAKLGTPILYVDGQGTLSDEVKEFIASAKATKAIILGGKAAVSEGIEAELKALELTVDRAAGADRFETSVAIAKKFASAYNAGIMALATGNTFPDALAGGVYASLIGAPVVLVDNGYANADAILYAAGLDLTNVVVFGGTAAVSNETVAAVLSK